MVDTSEETTDSGEDPLTYYDAQCLQLFKQYASNLTALEAIDLETGPCRNSTFDVQCLREYAANQTYLDDAMDRCRNATGEDYDPFYFYQTGQLIFLWILLILIVVGNLAVLVALGMSNTRKSRMNYFIKHLAIADLSVGLISVLTDIVWKITVSWHAGNIVCKVIRFSQVCVTYSSTYVLVALSIDRYDAICHPMNFSRGWRRARALVAAAWILSAIFSTPMLVLYQEGVIEGQIQCWIDLPEEWHWKLYMTLVSVSLLVLPALLIFACYIVIVRTIWVQSGALTASAPTNTRTTSAGANRDGRMGAPMLDEDQDSRRASSRGIIPRAKIKTVKMTFVIVFVFILCWAPYIVFDLLQVYGHIPKTKTMTAVTTFIQSLAPLNSAANPLIYCLFSTHLCRNLRKIPALEWLATQFECLLRVVFCWPASSSLGCCCSDASGREGRHSVDQDTHPSNERPNNHHFRRLAAKTASDTRTTQLSSTCASQPESIRLIGPLRLKSSRSSVSAKSAGQSASGPASAGAAKSEENGRLHSSKRMEETICEELNVSSTRSEWV